jgi:hypothetical protein
MSKHHGLSKTAEYQRWIGMKARCLNPTHPSYPWYGAKGITVHPLWMNDFPAFLSEIGPCPTPKHTVDRIDGTKGYEPGNVRWATMREQNRNKSNLRVVSYRGQSKTVAEWAELRGMSGGTILSRLNRGLSPAKALSRQKTLGGAPSRKLSAHGRTMTLAEWSKELGLSRQVIFGRIKKGWPLDQVLRPVHDRAGPPPETIVAFGESLTIKQWAEKTGIPEPTIRGRLRRGRWTPERAVSP